MNAIFILSVLLAASVGFLLGYCLCEKGWQQAIQKALE